MSFAAVPLDSVGLSPAQLASCTRADLHTAQDLFLCSPQELIKKLQLRPSATVQPQQVVNGLLRQVALAVRPPIESLNQEAVEEDKNRWIRFGDEGLDYALGGGVKRGVLTEIVGESAAGKSHLALTLALTVQQSDMTADPGGAIILTTEREIASDRLLNLAIIMLEPHDDAHEAVPKKVKPYLDDIHSTKLKEIDHLINCITYVLPRMLEERNGVHRSVDNRQGPPRRPIRLLILDSITSLLRGDTTSPTNSLSLTERSRYICTIADQLKSLAAKYDLAVVVVNQVSDVFSRIPAPQSPVLIEPPSSSSGMLSQFYSSGVEEPPMLYSTQSRWFSGQSGSLKKEASLGIVWANAVNVRIMLSRTGRRRMLSERDIMIARKRAKVSFLNGNHPLLNDDELEHISDESTPTLIRRFHVVFSPFAPPSTTDYVISASGVHTLPNTTKVQDATSDVRSRARRAQAIRKMEREQNGDDGGDGGDDGVGNALDNDEVGRDVIAGVEGVVNEVNEDEFDNEIFDDLGDIPAEFWDGKLTEQGRAVSGE